MVLYLMIESHLRVSLVSQWRISVLDAFSLPSGFLIKGSHRIIQNASNVETWSKYITSAFKNLQVLKTKLVKASTGRKINKIRKTELQKLKLRKM